MSSATELKEFFYVDVDRVRSLLAQLQGGIVDSLKSELNRVFEAPPSEVAPRTRSEKSEESRSFQEMLFVAFEEMASDAGWILDLNEIVQQPEQWSTGGVHQTINEGQLLRLRCDVQVLDGKLFTERIQRFEKMVDAMVRLFDEAIPSGTSAKQRKEFIEAAKNKIRGASSTQINAIAEFVSDSVGDSIAARFMPCGAKHVDYGFSGALLNRREYIQEEREHLFSRYGAVASSWTCLLQVAAIPSKPDEDEGASRAVDSSDVLAGPTSINRAVVERIAGELLAMMESIGIVEGPRWPSISVTPLGVYRSVPKPAA